MERVILTTGGTGGHIFPALAVAEEIRRRSPRALILFMGGKYGQEADLAAKAGLDFIGLPVRGVMGRGLKGAAAAFGIVRGLASAATVIRKIRPEIIVGFGGYAAFAGVFAGRMAGTPTAIHEQNSFPGMSNRLLGRIVDHIFLSMPDRQGIFAPSKSSVVGNPVRSGIIALYEHSRSQRVMATSSTLPRRGFPGEVPAPGPFAATEGNSPPSGPEREQTFSRPPRLLVMGGSQGARAINEGMAGALDALLGAGVEIRHQTGQGDYERMRAVYREARAEHVRVEAFITDIPKAYAWADLVFCRAGASTLAEITAAGLPALLTPFPLAAQDHQRHNVRHLVEEGAAVALEQDEFSHNPARLARELLALLRDRPRLELMSEKSFAAAKPYAARDLVDGLEALLRSRPPLGGIGRAGHA
jgi:UDP-N-acetylglucosamine--N-acetylmuramyl-(pentapeptide) pyrophosphoryl-undecaprenol N-acetylglucosamine transferase